MKKIFFVVLILFSLGQEKVSLAFSGADFSEEALNESIEEYIQFFEEWTKPAEAPEPPSATEEEEAGPSLEKQMMLSRRAQALSQAVVDIGNEAYNIFLLQLMRRYLEEEKNREPIQILVDELIKVVQPELEERENHRVWKSAIQGGSDGFYVLATLEVLNAVGKKTKPFERLSNFIQKMHAGQPASVVISEATEVVVRGGAAGGVHLPVRIGEVAAKATSRGSFLKGLLSFRPSPMQVERWLGKPGLPRMGRAIALGVLLVMLYDGYKYHFRFQKLDPSLLFELIQTLSILDLAVRVIEFRETFDTQNETLSVDQKFEFLKTCQATQKLLESELKQLETTAPQFLANVPFDEASFQRGQESPLSLFLDSFYEAHPQLQKVFEEKEVSRVSLSPIELMLQGTAIQQSRLAEKIMREALK
ncbi:MAG: hypothetical protein HYY61_02540 [Deltaproteobacteria bacterium]|nr:hypothetical protein [Deltaproteobacteria bacterium]